MVIEHRIAHEFRVSGRVLSGAAMVFGDTSPDFNERFVPGALQHSGRVDINLQHDSNLIVARGAVLTDTGRELRVRAELEPGSAALSLIRRSVLNAFSIEFHARSERREAGIRVVERANLTGLALVDRGAYPQALAEVRRRKYTKGRPARIKAGRMLRSKIPYDKFLACDCLTAGGGSACIPLARFAHAAGNGMVSVIDAAFEAAQAGRLDRDILAVHKDYSRPIASARRGTLAAVSTDDGLDIEMALPAGRVGDDVAAAHESTGLIVRPLLDFERSDYVDSGEGRTYAKVWLRAMLVGSTDSRAGWPDATIEVRDPDGERAAPAPVRRRRLWL